MRAATPAEREALEGERALDAGLTEDGQRVPHRGQPIRSTEHARIYVPTERTGRRGNSRNYAYAKCRCGWVAIWPSTQEQAADAYRAHRRSVNK